MDCNMWTPHFCLSCDRQTDGSAYCSESCRLVEFEKTSIANSATNSQSLPYAYPWFSSLPTPARFRCLDFSAHRSLHSPRSSSQSSPSLLTPSSSHASLCSVISNSASTSPLSPPPHYLHQARESGQLSDQIKRELQAYAVSFEQVRLQRRRSC